MKINCRVIFGIMTVAALLFMLSSCGNTEEQNASSYEQYTAPPEIEVEMELEPDEPIGEEEPVEQYVETSPEEFAEPDTVTGPQPFTVVYDLLTDSIIQSLDPGATFEGRTGNTSIAGSPYLAISTEWGGDVCLTIGAHENGERYLHITDRTNMFLIRLNHSAIQFEPGDTVTFAGRWGDPFFDLNDTWFSVVISAYGSEHAVVEMGINYSAYMPEDGSFYISGVITEEMVAENLDTGPPHSGVRLYIWTSGEETEDYGFFIDSITVTRGGE